MTTTISQNHTIYPTRMSSREILGHIKRVCPDLHFDIEYVMTDIQLQNEIMIEFNQPWRQKKLRRTAGSCKYQYALTVTSKDKDPNTLLSALKRCTDLNSIESIEGNIELTKNDMPHAHCVVTSVSYLNKKQLERRFKAFICLKKLTNFKGWEEYYTKDEKDPHLLEYLKEYGLSTPKYKFG